MRIAAWLIMPPCLRCRFSGPTATSPAGCWRGLPVPAWWRWLPPSWLRKAAYWCAAQPVRSSGCRWVRQSPHRSPIAVSTPALIWACCRVNTPWIACYACPGWRHHLRHWHRPHPSTLARNCLCCSCSPLFPALVTPVRLPAVLRKSPEARGALSALASQKNSLACC